MPTPPKTPSNVAAADGAKKKGEKKPRSPLATVVELVVIVAIAVGLAYLIQAFVVKPYKIPSGSMEPTLQVGQRVLVDRLGESLGEPQVGGIYVFHPPEGAGDGGAENGSECGSSAYKRGLEACPTPKSKPSETNFIKRIVAGPGDTVSIVDGQPIVNGKKKSEPYIKPCAIPTEEVCNFPKPIKIPPGHWFMMGDNRGESDDSRFWGPVPTSWIIGEAFATYWPPSRIGTL